LKESRQAKLMISQVLLELVWHAPSMYYIDNEALNGIELAWFAARVNVIVPRLFLPFATN